jgi:PST family polysaccharide transporter
VLSFSGFFQSFNVIDYWFQSQVQSRYVVWIKSSSAIFFSFLKLAAISLRFPITGFSWLILGELIASALGMSFFFQKKLPSWSFDLSLAKSFFEESYPLIISSFAVIIYVKIDQVMLGQMVGNKAVGIYSLAARLSEAWYFIPAIITSSIFPSVIEAKKISDLLYRQRLRKLYSLMVFVAVFVAVFVTIFADSIVLLLFGQSFIEASSILKVHIWAAIFVFLGGASSQWLLLEKLNHYSSFRTILGCVFNVMLNLLLIPLFGGLGAAFATLISYFIATFSIFCFKKTRQCALDMMSALNPLVFLFAFKVR